MNSTISNALLCCSLFQGLTIQDISNVLQKCHPKTKTLHRQDAYYLSGDIYRNVDIVIFGEMVVRMTGASGRQVELIRVKCGEIIAPCYIYSTNRQLPGEITPAETTQLLSFSHDSFKLLIDTYPIIRDNFIGTLSDISSYLAEKIGFLSLMTTREKVIHYLRSELRSQHSLHLKLGLSRQRIADSFGIQKFSLLRCIASLTREGIIMVKGKLIDILDISKLK